MKRLILCAFTVLLLTHATTGYSATTATDTLRQECNAQTARFGQSARIKCIVKPQESIQSIVLGTFLIDGIWISDTNYPDDLLTQTDIKCGNRLLRLPGADEHCLISSMALSTSKETVAAVMDSQILTVDLWNKDVLRAESTLVCDTSTLSVNFKTGEVLYTIVPRRNCEESGVAFKTRSYHLQRGWYYIDLTPDNSKELFYNPKK